MRAFRDNPYQVFSGGASQALTGSICQYLGVDVGEAYIGRFPDGEIRLKLNEDVRGHDVFLVQATGPPVNENLMELLVMVDAARRASARRITAVIPYYGYARMDRKDEGRVPITAKLVANLLTTAGADRLLTLDLHAMQIQGFFDIPVDHLFAAPLVAARLREAGHGDAVVVAPDAGSIKLARAYATLLGTDLALVDKRRLSPEETEPTFVIGEVAGRDVVLVDDIVSTAGSVCAAARALGERGVNSVYVAATHAVLCGPAMERLAESPIKRVFVTDSVCPARGGRDEVDWIEVVGVAPLLGEAIRRIHEDASISALFDGFA